MSIYFSDRLLDYVKQTFGVPTLLHGTAEDWADNENLLRKEYPYYLKFENMVYGISSAIRSVKRTISDVIWWFRYRTTDQYHVVKTDLPPKYYDKDVQMLHANFQLLVDYVEHECAWMQEIATRYTDEYRKRKFWERWKPNEEQGLAYLRWASNLRNEFWVAEKSVIGDWTDQAIYAQEIMKLYLWWKYDYSVRCDLFEFESEPGSYCYDTCSYLYELEDKYKKEEEEMLCRLMKIRTGLWT